MTRFLVAAVAAGLMVTTAWGEPVMKNVFTDIPYTDGQMGRRQLVDEKHLLGITREQIGAWLMRYWDMPDELATALRFQHDPSYDGVYAEYPNLVCLAVRLLRSHGIGSGPVEEIPDALLERLGLSREKANDVTSKVLDAEVLLRELASQFGQP